MSFRPYNLIKTSGIADTRSNNTGATINKGIPVRINTSGTLDFVNVSTESQIDNIAGISEGTIPTGSAGSIVNSGKIEDITTAATFGDPVYISKTGNLTSTKPSIGVGSFVAGDFVVVIGVIAKNEQNPILKDLIVSIYLVGQL